MNIGGGALKECRIRLPTSLSMLTIGRNVIGLLEGVKEVVMSSRVNLSLLVDRINNRSNYYLDPNLKFRFLFNNSVPESFFSHEMSLTEVVGSDASSLRFLVDSAFKDHLHTFAPLFASLLQCKVVELPKDVLFVLLPLIYGEFTELNHDEMLNDVVAEVDEEIKKQRGWGGLEPRRKRSKTGSG